MKQENVSFLTYFFQDFPGGPIVKIPPCNSGGVDLIPGQGTRIPHAAEQLSPCTATTRATAREPVSGDKRSHMP